jgi:hypothetical protein
VSETAFMASYPGRAQGLVSRATAAAGALSQGAVSLGAVSQRAVSQGAVGASGTIGVDVSAQETLKATVGSGGFHLERGAVAASTSAQTGATETDNTKRKKKADPEDER